MATQQNAELDDLMSQAAGGDQVAFRQFYDRASPSILAILVRLMNDRYQAEDVLQDAMVVAWNKASEFDPGIASAKTWITTIARRRALDLLRNDTRRQEILHDDARDIRRSMGLDRDSSAAAPESAATAQRLVHCLGELDPNASACIQFAYLDGLTYNEIAARLSRSLGTVKSWVRRSLAKLKVCMQR